MRDEKNESKLESRNTGAVIGIGKLRIRKSYLWASLVAVLVLGAAALGRASVPHSFATGDTLNAADLNGNFTALDTRIATLEGKEPFAGTYPAVKGWGLPSWFCGAAPATINVSPTIPATGGAYSNAFGEIIYTNAGAVGQDFSFGVAAPTGTCPTTTCTSPLTYYLKSPVDQTITVHAFVDDTGAVYVNGTQRAVTTGAATIALSYTATANTPFSISFMGCSNNGPSIGFTVNDPFITTYGLQVDYDATFHRSGK